MIRSMTGFGRCRRTVEGLDITVELKSVNSRFLDCTVKTPRAYSYLEERVRAYLASRGVVRGKVDLWLGIEVLDSGKVTFTLDEGYLEGYLAALGQLRDGYGLRDDISVMSVARSSPELFRVVKPEADADKDWEKVLPVLEEAVNAFLLSREKEGETLAADIRTKATRVAGTVERIEALSEQNIATYRERLAQRVRDALDDNELTVDETRLLTECALHADRVAVDEEITRLRTHLASLGEILTSHEPVGRKLDFLMQEINRETNTIGSKCNDAAIAALVVDTKCELEKIREQLQNLE